MELSERYTSVLEWFERNVGTAQTELHYTNPFELLVAVILSAQCTDKRVNIVTPGLLARFPDCNAMADAGIEEIRSLISSISYPNSKAAHLKGMAAMLRDEYGGIVPDDIDSLMKMPGVGRKTANVIASIVYDKPVIAVDTHVFRVSRRIGLSDGKNVDAVERDLEAHIPENRRATAHHWLILHGRYVCTARNPKCAECGLQEYCADYINRNAIIGR